MPRKEDVNATLDNAKDPSQPLATNPSLGDITSFASSQPAGTAAPTNTTQAVQSPDVPLAVGTPNWEKDLGQRMAWMMQNQTHRAELQVTPLHLGPLHLQIELNGSQASVSFTTPHANVRETIENALPQLREMLETQGLQLSGAGVHQQGAGHHTGEAWQGRQETPWQGRRRGVESVHSEPLVSQLSASRSRRLVDYFA